MKCDIEIIKLTLFIIAALFTYYKFFREGTHKQRIEFDIDLRDLGCNNKDRIIEIGVIAENKGNVEHRFKQISLRILGIKKKSQLQELENYEPRLAFPLKLHTVKLINEIDKYYFVRPKVKQRFPITVRISIEISHLLVQTEFNYSSGAFHKAERAFSIDSQNNHYEN